MSTSKPEIRWTAAHCPWPELAITYLEAQYGVLPMPQLMKNLQGLFPAHRKLTHDMIYGKAHRMRLKHPRPRGGRVCAVKGNSTD